MTRPRIIWSILSLVLIIGLVGVLGLSETAGQESKDSREILKQADGLFKAEKWKEAVLLYHQLINQYREVSGVRNKRKQIDAKIKTCEEKLGISKDIKDIFHGQVELKRKSARKNILKVIYDFSDPKQIDDFVRSPATNMSIDDGALEISGSEGYGSCSLLDAIFKDELTVQCSITILPADEQEADIAVFYNRANGTGYLFSMGYQDDDYYYSTDTQRDNCIRFQRSKKWYDFKSLGSSKTPEIKTGQTYQVKIQANKGLLTFTIDKKLIRKVRDKTLTKGRLLFGGYESRIRYDNIQIEGMLDPVWLDKAYSRLTTLALTEEVDDSFTSSIILEKPESLMKLSVENKDSLAELPPPIVTVYQEACKEMAQIPTVAGSRDDFDEPAKKALSLFDRVIKQAPSFLAAYYRRAECHLKLGEKKNALGNCLQATTLSPDFFEAHVLMGCTYLSLSEFSESMNCFNDALRVNPKYSYAYSGRACLNFALGQRKQALADLEQALKLNPGNTEAQNYLRNFQHVIDGPTWPEPDHKETEHFDLMTNVSATQCAMFAGHLEAMYKYYDEVFNYKDKLPQKKRVLIFNTSEGYSGYARLSKDDMTAYPLGYYHPLYQELLVYEEAGKEAPALKVLYHEGFHMFIHQVFRGIPVWFNEGFAEYFSGSEVENVQAKEWSVTRQGLLHEQLGSLKSAIGYKQTVSFAQIMNETQSEFYKHGRIRHDQAWSMVHFFMHYQNGVHKKLLMSYFKALKEGQSPRQAFNEISSQQDLNKIEQEWRNYVLGLKED